MSISLDKNPLISNFISESGIQIPKEEQLLLTTSSGRKYIEIPNRMNQWKNYRAIGKDALISLSFTTCAIAMSVFYDSPYGQTHKPSIPFAILAGSYIYIASFKQCLGTTFGFLAATIFAISKVPEGGILSTTARVLIVATILFSAVAGAIPMGVEDRYLQQMDKYIEEERNAYIKEANKSNLEKNAL